MAPTITHPHAKRGGHGVPEGGGGSAVSRGHPHHLGVVVAEDLARPGVPQVEVDVGAGGRRGRGRPAAGPVPAEERGRRQQPVDAHGEARLGWVGVIDGSAVALYRRPDGTFGKNHTELITLPISKRMCVRVILNSVLD